VSDADVPSSPPTPPPPSPRKAAWQQVALAMIGAAAGGVVGFVGAGTLIGRGVGPGGMLAVSAATVAGLYVAVALHELGHLIAGKLAGHRVYAYVAGPLWVTPRRPWVSLRWRALGAGIGGMVVAVPPPGRDKGRAAETAFLLGGPLANLLTGGAALPAARLVDGAARPVLDAVLLGFGGLSLLLGLVNLLPLRLVASALTDGRAIWVLWRARGRDAAEGRLMRLVRRAAGLSLAGVRPRDWDPDLVAALADAPDVAGPAGGAASLMLYAVAVDRGDLAGADVHLWASEARYGTPNSTLNVERAFLDATLRGHVDDAVRRRLAKPGPGLIEPHARLRAEAAVALADGDVAAARRLAAEGLAAAERPVVHAGDWDRDLLRQILARCDAFEASRVAVGAS